MNLLLNGKSVGAVGGFVVGLLFVLAGWRIALILLGLCGAGFLVGMWFDSRGDVNRAVRAFFRRLSGS